MKDNLKEIEISKETKRFLDDLYYLKDKEKEVKTGGDIFFTKDEQIHHKGEKERRSLFGSLDNTCRFLLPSVCFEYRFLPYVDRDW